MSTNKLKRPRFPVTRGAWGPQIERTAVLVISDQKTPGMAKVTKVLKEQSLLLQHLRSQSASPPRIAIAASTLQKPRGQTRRPESFSL